MAASSSRQMPWCTTILGFWRAGQRAWIWPRLSGHSVTSGWRRVQSLHSSLSRRPQSLRSLAHGNWWPMLCRRRLLDRSGTVLSCQCFPRRSLLLSSRLRNSELCTELSTTHNKKDMPVCGVSTVMVGNEALETFTRCGVSNFLSFFNSFLGEIRLSQKLFWTVPPISTKIPFLAQRWYSNPGFSDSPTFQKAKSYDFAKYSFLVTPPLGWVKCRQTQGTARARD